MHHIVKRKKYISISIRGFSRGGSSIIASNHLFASLQKLPRWKASTFGSPMLSTNSRIIGGTYVTWWDFDGTFPPHGWCAALPVLHFCGRSIPSFLSCVFYQMMRAYRVTCMSLPPHYDNFLSLAAHPPSARLLSDHQLLVISQLKIPQHQSHFQEIAWCKCTPKCATQYHKS